MAPKTLRQALDAIEEMLTDKPYSAQLGICSHQYAGPTLATGKLRTLQLA